MGLDNTGISLEESKRILLYIDKAVSTPMAGTAQAKDGIITIKEFKEFADRFDKNRISDEVFKSEIKVDKEKVGKFISAFSNDTYFDQVAQTYDDSIAKKWIWDTNLLSVTDLTLLYAKASSINQGDYKIKISTDRAKQIFGYIDKYYSLTNKEVEKQDETISKKEFELFRDAWAGRRLIKPEPMEKVNENFKASKDQEDLKLSKEQIEIVNSFGGKEVLDEFTNLAQSFMRDQDLLYFKTIENALNKN